MKHGVSVQDAGPQKVERIYGDEEAGKVWDESRCWWCGKGRMSVCVCVYGWNGLDMCGGPGPSPVLVRQQQQQGRRTTII